MKHATLYVGVEKDGGGKPLNPVVKARAMLHIRKTAATMFGGYTLTHIEGGWVNPQGELIMEGAVRLDLYAEAANEQFGAFARLCMKELYQAQVILEIQESGATLVQYENDQQKAA